jgi:plastocyanin
MTFRLLGAWLGAAALLLSASHAFAAPDMTSVDIVEPKSQSKWGYAPGTLTVEPGTWITWSNAGQDAHTVTAVSGTFDSGPLGPSEGFSWFFAEPGTFDYVCTLHTWMTGMVIVGDGVALDNPPRGEDPPPVSDPPPADNEISPMVD